MPNKGNSADDLATSERRLRLAFEATGAGFWDWNVDDDDWYFSPGFYTMLGYEQGEISASRATYEALIHPDDREAVVARIERGVAEATDRIDAEYRLRGRNGDWHWVLCRGHAVPGEPGGPATQLLGVHLDISQRRQTEQALHLSEDRYRMLVENQGEGIGIVDGDEVFTYANPAAERIFGVEAGMLVGKSLREFIDDEEFARVSSQTQRRRTGSRDTYELGYARPDGERRTMLVTATPSYAEDGAYLGAFGVFRDITERKLMELALQEEEERYRLLIEALPHGVALLQGETIVFANRGAVQLLGYEDLDTMLAAHPVKFLVPEERERVLSIIDGIRSGEEHGAVHYETRARHASGHIIPVEVHVTSTSYRGKPALQFFMIDITERQEAAEAHARLEEQLRQAQRLESIGRLAGGIAHDFNNLLSPILIYSELALQDIEPGAAFHEDFTQIRHAVDQAKKLTQQLLAFGRRQVLQMKLLSLNHVVSEARQLLRRLIREDVDIVVKLQPDVGAVMADPSQLQQVLLNLAINAQDSMHQGGRMTIATDNVDIDDAYCRERTEVTPGPHVVLRVQDTGRGMDAETLAQIFEPFFTTKDIGKGTGLGLATVHGIVKQHGAHIEVHSELGSGTIFEVLLPRVEGDARHSWRPPPAQLKHGLRATVLVAEDDDLVRAQLVRILRRFGLDVIVAVDGADALEKAQRYDGSIDLLLSDMIMPRMNGRDLFTKLQPAFPELKVIYISGYTDAVIAGQGVIGEDVHFLQKPFSLKEMADKLRQVLGDRA